MFIVIKAFFTVRVVNHDANVIEDVWNVVHDIRKQLGFSSPIRCRDAGTFRHPLFFEPIQFGAGGCIDRLF